MYTPLLEPLVQLTGPNDYPFQLGARPVAAKSGKLSNISPPKLNLYHPYASPSRQSPSLLMSVERPSNKMAPPSITVDEPQQQPQQQMYLQPTKDIPFTNNSMESRLRQRRRSSIIHVTTTDNSTRIDIIDIIESPTRDDLKETTSFSAPNTKSNEQYNKKRETDKILKPESTQQKLKFTVVETDGSGVSYNKGTWSAEEHEAFLKGYELYGNDWKKVSAEFVPTRSKTQLASHAQKYFQRAAYLKQADADRRKELMNKSRSLFFLTSHLQ